MKKIKNKNRIKDLRENMTDPEKNEEKQKDIARKKNLRENMSESQKIQKNVDKNAKEK